MKKLLGILVLGLLWCGLAQAASSLPECKGNDPYINKYTKKHFNKIRKWSNCHGTTLGPKGEKYVGEFYNGEFHGQGTFYHQGRKYVGQYKNHKRHGQGTYTYANREKYIGEWKEAEYSGQGTYYYSNGDKYSGEWNKAKYNEPAKRHEQHGKGTYTFADGAVDEGIWEYGKLVTSVVKEPKYDDEKIIIIGSGSGFFINEKGYIVSNAHVIGVCKKVIAYEEGEEITLKILATDMVNDIGLVKGKFNNKQYLNIKTDGAELGEQIVTFGYPLSQDLSDSVKLTQGIVSSLSGPDNNYSQIQIDAAIQPGNSGGPVLNMNGQVVGIASAGLSKLYMAAKAAYIPENVNFAVAAQSLTTFLKANKVKVTSGPTKIYSTKELAKIGEPATIQLFCMNTKAEYAKLKEADKHSDVLLDLQ